MPITFGSVGDIVSVCLLVKDLVNALDEARGCKAEYQSAIRELWILDRALLEIDLLSRTHGNGSTPELRSLCETAQRAAAKCKDLVAEFLSRIRKYKSSFDDSHRPGLLRKTAMSIRWQVGEREALERFRVEIAGTSSSLQMLLATANVNLLAINKKEVKDQLNQIEQRHRQRDSGQNVLLLDIKDRISNASQHITDATALLRNVGDALRLDWLRQLGSDLKSLMHRVIATNIATYHAIVSVQKLLSSRLERTLTDEPFILEDPIGRIAPVHLQWVTSWDAFNAVLEIRFRDLQGFKKIKEKQYSLQEKATARDIDKSRPWQRAFLPGQRIEMSFLFHSSKEIEPSNAESNTVTCPGCQFMSSQSANTDTQCPNCMMWFRRIIVITEVDPPPSAPLPNPWKSTSTFGKPNFTAQLSGPLKPGKKRVATDDLEGEDDVREFKRVRLISENKLVKRQQFGRTSAQRAYTTFPTTSEVSKMDIAALSSIVTGTASKSDWAMSETNDRSQQRALADIMRSEIDTAEIIRVEIEKARKVGLISALPSAPPQPNKPPLPNMTPIFSGEASFPLHDANAASADQPPELLQYIEEVVFGYDPYEILNISDYKVDSKEVETAYRRMLIKSFSPTSLSPTCNVSAAAYFELLKAAQEVLLDPVYRMRYDETGGIPLDIQGYKCATAFYGTAIKTDLMNIPTPLSYRRDQEQLGYYASQSLLPNILPSLESLLERYSNIEYVWLPTERSSMLSLSVAERLEKYSITLKDRAGAGHHIRSN